VLRQAPPFPSLADVGYLIEYPFFLLGILLLPARPIPVASRARIALDGLMIMTAAVTFSWHFVLGRGRNEQLDELEKRVAGAAGDTDLQAELATTTFTWARDERRLLRRYLRARFGIKFTRSSLT
jgi:hypothetical protein